MTSQSDTAPFNSMAIESFRFLVDVYGYTIQNVHNDSVEFTKDDLVVEVFREPGSFMIYVDILRKGTGEVYVLHEILKVLAPEKSRNAQCSGADSIKARKCLKHISMLCQQYLHGILSLDKAALERVAVSARDHRWRFTLECKYGPIRERANLAWHRKEWETARRLYEESEAILSNMEKRRLDLLIKRKLGAEE